MGILGTFVGLTLGISGFNLESSTEIQNSIKSLLGGIGTAFLTSLHGIGLSIVFGFIEKYHFNNFNKQINQLCLSLNKKHKLTKSEKDEIESNKQIELLKKWESIFIKHQTDIQKTVFNEISKLSKNILSKIDHNIHKSEELFISMQKQIKTIMFDLLITKDKNGNDLKLSNIQRDLLVESEKQTAALESFSTDLAEIIIEKFEESTRNTLLPKFVEILSSLDNLDTGIKSFSSDTGKDIGAGVNQAIESLQSELKVIVSDFREAFSSGAMQQLNRVVDSLDESAIVMENMPELLNTMLQQIKEFNNQELENRQQAIATELDSTISKFSNSIDSIINNLKEQETDRINREKDTFEYFENEFKKKQTQLSDEFNITTSQMKSLTNQMITNLNNTEKSQQERLSKFLETAHQESEIRKELLTEEMNSIFSNFKDSFSNVAENLQKIENAQVEREQKLIGTVNDTLTDSILQINELLSTQENYQRNIERLLSSVTKTIDSGNTLSEKYYDNIEMMEMISKDFKRVSQELNSSFSNLQDSSKSLKDVSTIVNNDLRKLTDFNTKTFDNMQQTYDKSIQTLSQLNKDYEMIQSELATIFDEIDNGVKSYSQLTREEINKTLMNFTSSLTDGTKNLAGSIELLNEFFEDISEKLEK